MSKKKFVILICARKGSRGLKNKNIKNFHGKPLVSWTLKQAKEIREKLSLDRIIVSTNCKKIIKISKSEGIEVPFVRSEKLSTSKSNQWLVWKHAINFLNKDGFYPDGVIILPITTPLRKISDVIKCIKLFSKKKCDGVITVADAFKNPFFNMVKIKNGNIDILIKPKKKIHNRQQAPKVYDMTSVAFVISSKFILKKNTLFPGKIKSIKVDSTTATDIDKIQDFEIAKFLKTYNEKKI